MSKPSNKNRLTRFAFAAALAAPLLLSPLQAEASVAQQGTAAVFQEAAQRYPSYDGIRLRIDDAELLAQVRAGLDLLKAEAPEHYEFVKHYIREIRESDRSGMHVRSGVFDLSKVSAVSPLWTASIIYHDAIHRYQHLAGKPFSGARGEAEANQKQLEFLRKVNAPAKMIAHLENIIAHGDHSDLDGDGKYTERDYVRRTWLRPGSLAHNL